MQVLRMPTERVVAQMKNSWMIVRRMEMEQFVGRVDERETMCSPQMGAVFRHRCD